MFYLWLTAQVDEKVFGQAYFLAVKMYVYWLWLYYLIITKCCRKTTFSQLSIITEALGDMLYKNIVEFAVKNLLSGFCSDFSI